MPTSLEHGPKYRYRKVNKGCHTLEMRTNGTCHNIPNTTHLRGRKDEGRGFKRIHNKMGEARTLNLRNIAAWLIFTCLHLHPFCLCLGDHALAPCALASYVYMQRQRQETCRQAMERKRCVDNAQWV